MPLPTFLQNSKTCLYIQFTADSIWNEH